MDDTLRTFAQQVAEDFPQLRQVLDQAKAGEISEQDALRCMAEILATTPELRTRFQTLAQTVLAPRQPADHGNMVIHKQRGLPQLNPLVEAALIERAQFDHDIPEHRTGELPPGVLPAVPVDTMVRNPVALGMMLQAASQQIAEQLAVREPERQRLVAQVALGDKEALAQIAPGGVLAQRATEDMVLSGKSAELDLPGYRRGQLATPVSVPAPTGAVLSALTPQERKQYAWQFFSTTQGRRSAVASIAELISARLCGEGFEVRTRPFEPGAREPVLAAQEWTVKIDGPGAIQPAFSMIDVAAACIAKGLTTKMAERRGAVVLEVTAINTVDVRAVGWVGRLLATNALLEE